MKVTGPFAGREASGSLADAITFQTTRSRQVVRRKPRPKDAKTGAQLSSRAMLTFLAAYWQVMPDVKKLTWETEAAARSTSIYNAYLGENLRRWGRNQSPSQTLPANEVQPYSAVTGLVVYSRTNSIWIRFTVNPRLNNWGGTIHRSQQNGFTPGRDNCIAVIYTPVPGHAYHLDTPLAPGTYYYRSRPFSIDAKTRPWYWPQQTGVATS